MLVVMIIITEYKNVLDGRSLFANKDFMFDELSCDFYFDAKVQAFINAYRLCIWDMAALHITIDFFVGTFSGIDIIRLAIVNT